MARNHDYVLAFKPTIHVFIDKKGFVTNWDIDFLETTLVDMYATETQQFFDTPADMQAELGKKVYESVMNYIARLGLTEVYHDEFEEPF